jgi:signal transduction histidine kinase
LSTIRSFLFSTLAAALRFLSQRAILFAVATPILVLCALDTLAAQSHNFHFETISTEQGLSHISAFGGIQQDRLGFMWFGTLSGLNRWDGYTMKVYKPNPNDSTSIISADIHSLYLDKRGRLWVGTGVGLDLYDSDRDAFVHFNDEKSPTGLSFHSVLCLAEDRHGNLWIGTERGLNRFDETRNVFVHYMHSPNDSSSLRDDWIRDIMLDKSGTLWIATKAGVERFDEKRNAFVHFFTPPRTKDAFSLFEDSKENLWVAEVDGHVYCFDKFRNLIDRFPLVDIVGRPPRNEIYSWAHSFGEDVHGRIWIGTHTDGLFIFDPRSQRLSKFTDEEPLRHSLNKERINHIFRDDADGMWLMTERGVRYYDPLSTKFQLYTTKSGERRSPDSFHRDVGGGQNPSDNSVTALIEDAQGYIWIGTGNGLNRLDRRRNTVTAFRRAGTTALGGSNIQALWEDNEQNLWIGGGVAPYFQWLGFLDCFHKARTKLTHARALGANVRAIHEDSNGELWVGLENEGDNKRDDLLRYDRQGNLIGNYSLIADGIWTIYEDRSSRLWFGSMYMGGVNVFDKKTQTFTYIPSNSEDATTINGGGVRAMSEDAEGNLWLGTWGGGFCRFDPVTKIAKRFTERDGLPSDFVKGILPDDHGNLWISTENGITRFDPRTNSFRNFTVNDGLQGAKFLSNSCWKGKDGWMWFGGENGLNAFHPDSVRDNPNIPRMRITSVKVFDKELRLRQSCMQTKEIELAHNQNFFTFAFAALSYADPKRNQYAYMMEGVDAGWVHAGTRRYASYTNVAPGSYTFRVKGSNNDGVWNEEGATMRLIITPPWWKTVWAYGSYGVLLIAGMYSFRRHEKKRERLKQQAELERVESEKRLQQEFSQQLIETQEAERKRVASELHDSLGQHLLMVNKELQLYQQGKGQNDPDIERTTAIVKDTIKEVREIASNLHPHHLEKLGLRAAVEAMIEQVSRSTSLKFDASIEDVDDKLNMQAKINLYRVLQEAIANIVRHSGATHAKITITQTANNVQTIVEDNGKGFTPGSSPDGRQGFGLKSMAERIRLMSGTIAFDTTSGTGTRIEIAIPMQ